MSYTTVLALIAHKRATTRTEGRGNSDSVVVSRHGTLSGGEIVVVLSSGTVDTALDADRFRSR
jgi:hypothetical protein